MTVKISNQETSYAHETRDMHYNELEIMQCIVTQASGMYS